MEKSNWFMKLIFIAMILLLPAFFVAAEDDLFHPTEYILSKLKENVHRGLLSQ